MGDVLDLLPKVRGQRDRRQALRLRLDRRARELAKRDQAAYFAAMLFEVYTGRVSEEAISHWQPLKGEIRKEA